MVAHDAVWRDVLACRPTSTATTRRRHEPSFLTELCIARFAEALGDGDVEDGAWLSELPAVIREGCLRWLCEFGRGGARSYVARLVGRAGDVSCLALRGCPASSAMGARRAADACGPLRTLRCRGFRGPNSGLGDVLRGLADGSLDATELSELDVGDSDVSEALVRDPGQGRPFRVVRFKRDHRRESPLDVSRARRRAPSREPIARPKHTGIHTYILARERLSESAADSISSR